MINEATNLTRKEKETFNRYFTKKGQKLRTQKMVEDYDPKKILTAKEIKDVKRIYPFINVENPGYADKLSLVEATLSLNVMLDYVVEEYGGKIAYNKARKSIVSSDFSYKENTFLLNVFDDPKRFYDKELSEEGKKQVQGFDIENVSSQTLGRMERLAPWFDKENIRLVDKIFMLRLDGKL